MDPPSASTMPRNFVQSRGVDHRPWLPDVRSHKLLEGGIVHSCDGLAGPVGPRAIHPALSGLKEEWIGLHDFLWGVRCTSILVAYIRKRFTKSLSKTLLVLPFCLAHLASGGFE